MNKIIEKWRERQTIGQKIERETERERERGEREREIQCQNDQLILMICMST